jgi:hypothetical protein
MRLNFPKDLANHHPQRPTRLFLDTEFSSFGTPGGLDVRLLSLGIIDERGDYAFYAECAGWSATECTQFVKDRVLPLLSGHPLEPLISVVERLHDYLANFDHAVVHCDYHGDWDWLSWLLIDGSENEKWPSSLHHAPQHVDVSEWPAVAREAAGHARSAWFSNCNRHHAADDANGLRYAWLKARESLGWVDDPAAPLNVRSDEQLR